jgi:DNA sulfur modification protein DndD
MIEPEYQRFLQTLSSKETSDNVRKIGNIVLTNIDSLIPLSTHQGQRVKKTSSITQLNWDTASNVIQPLPKQLAADTFPTRKLKSISIGPFRGFAKNENFDLLSELVLIYGPNGTGKSSFCEALEYALLGSVAEADSKRFRELHSYLKNAHTNSFIPPQLVGIDENNQDINILANEALYRFCFVEKNRIDSFSRIAAQAPAKQSELISTLFGLDAFNEFVRNFSPEIDGKYIDLVGVRAIQLSQKSLSLAGEQQQVNINTDALTTLKQEETNLAQLYRKGCAFTQMLLELKGNDQCMGRISTLETEIQQPVAVKSNLTLTRFQLVYESITNNLMIIAGKRQELANASQQVSFKRLYDAVVKIQPISPNNCPACKTPVEQVIINPYSNATSELNKLQHLAVLQSEVVQLEQLVHQGFQEVSLALSACFRQFSQNNVLETFVTNNVGQITLLWWNSLNQALADGFTPIQHIQTQVQQLEGFDKNTALVEIARQAKQSELVKLKDYAQKSSMLQARRSAAEQAIAKANLIIQEFGTANASLIKEAELEKAVVVRNQSIGSAYQEFHRRLNSYRSNLPSQLVADLGDIVVDLYNAFNRNDSRSELLSSVKLPLAQNQKLKISFQDQPEKEFDALHVLSEGHVRCIGLSILLAKNLKENCPFLIFDDPVNAIDDDHRESIRMTLFDDKHFSDKQIILTCHGEEFFKDIQNLLPAPRANTAKALAFLPRLDEAHIRVDFNCAPRNYVIAAIQHLERNEVRDALSKSRQALESLTKGKVWRYINRYGDGNLSLKLRSANHPIELRNLTEQLRSKVIKGDFCDINKNTVFEPLDKLLGINGNSREWRYLNKGTHEESDRAEFDRNTVEAIINNIEKLDAVL